MVRTCSVLVSDRDYDYDDYGDYYRRKRSVPLDLSPSSSILALLAEIDDYLDQMAVHNDIVPTCKQVEICKIMAKSSTSDKETLRLLEKIERSRCVKSRLLQSLFWLAGKKTESED